jgi:hypothetical protein
MAYLKYKNEFSMTFVFNAITESCCWQVDFGVWHLMAAMLLSAHPEMACLLISIWTPLGVHFAP